VANKAKTTGPRTSRSSSSAISSGCCSGRRARPAPAHRPGPSRRRKPGHPA
jgi:hypothetical protein